MFSEKDLLFLVPDAPEATPLSGQYRKKVLIVAAPETNVEGCRAFLEKILGAAKILLEEDTLYRFTENGETVPLAQWIRERQPEQVLIFGYEAAQVGVQVQADLYQPVFFQNANLLFADTLSALEPDKTLKTKLWTAMQLVFKI